MAMLCLRQYAQRFEKIGTSPNLENETDKSGTGHTIAH